ncbi:hypothetical protein GQ457_10G014120 [Hibiscus cannabinus]
MVHLRKLPDWFDLLSSVSSLIFADQQQCQFDQQSERGDFNDQLSQAVRSSKSKRRATTAIVGEFGRRTSPVWDHYTFVKLADGVFAEWLTGFTALEGYFDVIGSILEVGNDVLLLGNGWVMIWGCFGKMGCLYSVFYVKKQGKPVWVVRARNWKLREGENRLSGLLEGVSIASVGKAKRQGGSNITFVQVWFFPEFCISGVEYRYPISGIGTQIQHWNLGIGIGTKGGVSVPKPPLGLEYRYWHSSTDTSCLETSLLGHESDPMLFRRLFGTRTFRCVVNHHRMLKLHLDNVIKEPGYAIIGMVSKTPFAYSTIENVVLVKQLEQLDPCPC